MSHIFARITAFALLLTVVAVPLTARAQSIPEHVPNQLIVQLRASARAADALAVRGSVNATVVHRFKFIDAELWQIDGISVADAITSLGRDSRVDFVEPNYIVHIEQVAGDKQVVNAVIPNDTRFPDQWGLYNTGQAGGIPDADIDATEAWDVTTGGSVLVGLIGTGVDYNHVELANSIFSNPNEIAGNNIDDDLNGYIDDVRGWDFFNNDNNPIDDHGHTTHCAGIMAAAGNNGVGVAGVSWSARIIPLKFLGSTGSGNIANGIKALEYAAMMGAKFTHNPWGGGPFSQAHYNAIQATGLLFVTGVGTANANQDLNPFYPSSYDLANIVAVAGTSNTDAKASFSSFGATSVDLGAPAVSIVGTYPFNQYNTFTGTSQAASFVAGAACLLFDAAPWLSALSAKDKILSSVDVIPALNGLWVTSGRLNVANMLATVTGIDDGGTPSRVSLHANYPNPFNPSTTIAYDLPHAASVHLAIYDVRGGIVRDLVRAAQPAGRHTARWDGRDAERVPAASGVYFYRLEADGFAQTRKMVVLK